MAKYEGSSKSFRTSFFLTLIIKNFKNKLHHFTIQSPYFAMHFSQRPTNSLMPSGNMFLVECIATDAPLLSHHHHMKIVLHF